jgi:hypothetical protein
MTDSSGESPVDRHASPISGPIDVASNAFRKALSTHGYGFQYSVLNRIAEVVRPAWADQQWIFESSEVPVHVGPTETHIDFVLRRGNVFVIGSVSAPILRGRTGALRELSSTFGRGSNPRSEWNA